MSGEAQLEALLEIINTSARQVIAEYKKGGNEVPTIHSTTCHPMDFAVDTIALNKGVRLLEDACQRLCASLAPPQHTLKNLAVPVEWACVRVVIRAKVADALEKYPNGLHVDELAKLVNLEKGKLARVLRFLAAEGCFTEVEPNTFANNRMSLVTLASSATGAILRLGVDDISQGAAVLYETMTEPEYATSCLPEKAPVIYALKKKGFNGGFFDWMKEDAERRENFHRAMMGAPLSVLHHYPWNEVKTVCDVGAGIGGVSLPLSKMYPHLKITTQDLPEALVQAKHVWAKDAPEALQINQVEFVPLDFLQGSPVHGQDVYYLRNIIHDWPDAEASIILKNVRQAMAVHSRLLIHGTVLTPTSRGPNGQSFGVDDAPELLSPDLTKGSILVPYREDMIMWFVHNAKERTLDELIVLGSAAGVQLEKVYDFAESAVLEFRVAA